LSNLADLIAFRAAKQAKSEVVSLAETKCLFFIPDLLEIHSSDVSIFLDKS
jgi:hypothetical protein